MKKLNLSITILFAVILFSSCSRDYNPQLVGHFKNRPNQNRSNEIASMKKECIEPMKITHSEITATASANESEPDLKLLNNFKMQETSATAFSDKQQRSTEHAAQKIEKQIEKNNSKIEKLQSKSDDNATQQSIQKLSDDNKTLYAILGFIIPPLGVGLYEDGITTHFWIALLLMLCFWLPGAIYALVIILG